MNRRGFLHTSAAALASLAMPGLAVDQTKRSPRILLRSSWQVVNIGDIAHSPGVLALLERHIPEAEARLWASRDLSEEVAAMLRKRFPALRIVKGSLDESGRATNGELGETVAWADFLLHGSGPSLVGAQDVAAFVKHTGKPFGVYGITHGPFQNGNEKALLGRARFIFFRDSVSLAQARRDGVACPVMGFAPDGAFAFDIGNDAAAEAFLKAHELERGKFVCCIPRLRYTPYWRIRPERSRNEKRAARNEAMAEHDHAPLRAAISALVREASFKVLVCPEDKTQMAVGKEMIVDRLPADVRKGVVWREKFWLPDEALSTYRRSAGLFGLEMHSPIMCVGNSVPAIVGRFAEQTSKGFMWRDIGLGDWLFDFDQEADVRRYVPAVLAMVTDPEAAKRKTQEARDFVRRRQRETMGVLRESLS